MLWLPGIGGLKNDNNNAVLSFQLDPDNIGLGWICDHKIYYRNHSAVMFIHAEPILGVLDMYRLIWISGRFGGHKTALAFQIAKRYLERGYKLATNSRCVWSDSFDNIKLNDKNQLHAVVIMDEGGLYFKSGRQVEQIAAYAAKMDVVYIFPSFWPPTKAAQIINIQPVVSLKAAGLPVIVYKWRVDIGSFRDKGWFLWWDPAEIYGIYSRQDPGDDPDKIVKFLVDRTAEYRRRYDRSDNTILQLEEITEADKIEEAAMVIAESADSFSAVFNRASKRRR